MVTKYSTYRWKLTVLIHTHAHKIIFMWRSNVTRQLHTAIVSASSMWYSTPLISSLHGNPEHFACMKISCLFNNHVEHVDVCLCKCSKGIGKKTNWNCVKLSQQIHGCTYTAMVIQNMLDSRFSKTIGIYKLSMDLKSQQIVIERWPKWLAVSI